MPMTAATEQEATPPTAKTPVRGPQRGWASGRGTRALGLLIAVAVLVFVTLCSIAVGAKPIPFDVVLDALFAHDDEVNDHLIVTSLRIPRTLMGILVGVALGLAGAIMQG